jgi:hypothetical protein
LKPSKLAGYGSLGADAVVGVARVVEDVHGTITGLAGVFERAPPRSTGGLTGLVYRSVRGVAGLVGRGVDFALSLPTGGAASDDAGAGPEAVQAAINGVVGDHLARSGNPLAIRMGLRQGGAALVLDRAALTRGIASPSPHVVVLVHGLCMNDHQWLRNGHDHGAALARELACTPLYLHYNSGRHISTNGRELAALLETLVREWPVPIERLGVVGHSMGGLVARSACHHGEQAGMQWPHRLKDLVFLGTPHHGAPLERAGNGFDRLLRLTAYTAPFARIGGLRSDGIRDLRHGNLVDGDWQRREASHAPDSRTPVPLPASVRCHAIAATRREGRSALADAWIGDGLVPVASALGQHADPRRALRFPRTRQWIATDASHFDLLDDPRVYQRLLGWLRRAPSKRASTLRRGVV